MNGGWGALCRILNVPTTDGTFLRINEKAAMKELDEAMTKLVYVRWEMILGGVLAADWWCSVVTYIMLS